MTPDRTHLSTSLPLHGLLYLADNGTHFLSQPELALTHHTSAANSDNQLSWSQTREHLKRQVRSYCRSRIDKLALVYSPFTSLISSTFSDPDINTNVLQYLADNGTWRPLTTSRA